MITLAQVDARINAAWEAVNLGELSYTVHGRELTFHSLDVFQRHINWLLELRQSLSAQAEIAAGEPVCPVVTYRNTE